LLRQSGVLGPLFGKEAAVTDVIVRLSPEAAYAVQAGQPTPPALHQAQEKVRSLGLTLEPLHAGVEDASLAQWFRVTVEDGTAAEDVAAMLRTSPDVESAYVEPPSAPPG
jgi:hypothetical protein